jgi:hypothetical protein
MKTKGLLRQDKANYADVVSHVKGFEEKIIECNELYFSKLWLFKFWSIKFHFNFEVILHIVSKTYQTINYTELKEILGDISSKSR